MDATTCATDVVIAEHIRSAAAQLRTTHDGRKLRGLQRVLQRLQYTVEDPSTQLVCFFLETYIHDVSFNLCADFEYTETTYRIRCAFLEGVGDVLERVAARLESRPLDNHWEDFARLVAEYMRVVQELRAATRIEAASVRTAG